MSSLYIKLPARTGNDVIIDNGSGDKDSQILDLLALGFTKPIR